MLGAPTHRGLVVDGARAAAGELAGVADESGSGHRRVDEDQRKALVGVHQAVADVILGEDDVLNAADVT